MAASDVVQTPGNAFYDRLNGILDAHKFDAKVERLCQKYSRRARMAGRAWRRACTSGGC